MVWVAHVTLTRCISLLLLLMLLQESPAWPALVEACAAADVRLALLNARMSSKSFMSWFNSSCKRALLRHMLDNFSLIVPQSDIVSTCNSTCSWW